MPGNESSTWKPLARAALIAGGSLVLLGGVLYAAFWLPYRQTGDATPRSIDILPLEHASGPPAGEVQEPPYAWVDREAGIVRIPVEEAMQLVVERWPASEEAAGAARERERMVIPTDAGSGRFAIRGERRAASQHAP